VSNLLRRRYLAMVVVPRRGTYCLEPLSCHIPAANDAAVTVTSFSSVEADGLGEELRVLLAHSMRNGHHQLPRPAGMIRLDPVR
jgi:hypothetical protein